MGREKTRKVGLGKFKKNALMNQEDINWYLMNDVDINELYDKIQEKEDNRGKTGPKEQAIYRKANVLNRICIYYENKTINIKGTIQRIS